MLGSGGEEGQDVTLMGSGGNELESFPSCFGSLSLRYIIIAI